MANLAFRAVDIGGDVAGRWANDGGSVLELEVTGEGRLRGRLRLASDGTTYKPYQVVGKFLLRNPAASGVVASVIGWPRPASVTVWCGELSDDGAQMRTRWLSAAESEEALDWPEAIGGAVFRRVYR